LGSGHDFYTIYGIYRKDTTIYGINMIENAIYCCGSIKIAFPGKKGQKIAKILGLKVRYITNIYNFGIS
jgi:hypothetical protein